MSDHSHKDPRQHALDEPLIEGLTDLIALYKGWGGGWSAPAAPL
jgi:hypothetical protein